MDLDLRVVRYFLAVADELHFGRAANRLHIAQPSLSQQIRRLEYSLGHELFVRGQHGVTLSAAGQALVPYARDLVAAQVRAVLAVDRAGRGHSGVVRVAFIPATPATLTPLLRRLAQDEPDIRLELMRVDWTDQVQVLRDGRADLSFVRLPIDDAGLVVTALEEEPRVVGLWADHPLAGRSEVSILEITAEPIIDTDNQRAYWSVDPRPDGSHPTYGPLANTAEEMLEVVAAKLAICITPASIAAGYRRDDISFVRVADIEPSVTAIAYARDASPAARLVANAAVAVFSLPPTQTP